MTLPNSTDALHGTASRSSVQAWVVPYLIAWAEQQGMDASGIRHLPGMTGLTDPDRRVPEESVEATWRLAADFTDDDAIGIHVAEGLPRGALDLVEYAFRSSGSLAAGLQRLARYGRVLSDRVAARVESTGQGVLLMFRDTGSTALHSGRTEFALAMALKLARDGVGRNVTPVQVCFAHPAPKQTAEHDRFFGVPVRFAAGSNFMVLSAEDAARPLQGADEALLAIVRRRLDKLLTERDGDVSGSLGDRVRRLIVTNVGKTTLSPDAVGRALAVSRRTLSRRLAEEGTSFRRILDDVQRELACALLHDRSASVADVAFFLQYSEPAAFNRSFRRWTGQTPQAFRHQTAADGATARQE